MDQREALIFLHILGGFLLAAGVGAEAVLGMVAARSTGTQAIATLAHAQVMVSRLVIAPAGIVLAVFGTWLVAKYGFYEFSEGWISGGYAIWIVSTAVGTGYLVPHARRLRDRARVLVSEGVAESEELRRQADEPLVKVTGTALNVLLIVAILIMVARPGA